MENINIDTFSEQLGIYDFFNVIVSGAIMGMLWYFIWPGFFEKTLFKIKVHISVVIIFAIILCYFIGMIIQEIGSIADRYIFHIKDNMQKTFLKTEAEKKTKKICLKNIEVQIRFNEKKNRVLYNPIRLNMCRRYAAEILQNSGIECGETFSEEQAQYVCVRMEYRISYIGKSGKMEKLRALFSMARSMVVCMILLMVLLIYTVSTGKMHLWGISSEVCGILLVVCGVIFYYRMRKTMRYMLLIMIGHYEADYYSRNHKANENIVG